jgi:hypothetical protein
MLFLIDNTTCLIIDRYRMGWIMEGQINRTRPPPDGGSLFIKLGVLIWPSRLVIHAYEGLASNPP